jgi:dihydrofolate reductase
MLIYSMSTSVDGFIADREGGFGWTIPNEEQFRLHLALTRELGGYLCGRRLYETILAWETDQSLRDTELRAAFADAWCAIPKVVFSRTLDSLQGNARLAEASLPEEVATALDATARTSRSAAPPWPRRRSSSASSTSCACSATRSSSVAARRSCRPSPNTSRWT